MVMNTYIHAMFDELMLSPNSRIQVLQKTLYSKPTGRQQIALKMLIILLLKDLI